MKILHAALTLLLVLPISSHAAYHFHEHMVSNPGHTGTIWACANELYREPELKLAIAHYDSRARTVHCYLFAGRLRPGETQIIKFDGMAGSGNFGVLRGNPNVMAVFGRCRMNIHAEVYAQPRYASWLATGGVTGAYEMQLPVQSTQPYRSARLMVTGYRYITRDCVSASG